LDLSGCNRIGAYDPSCNASHAAWCSPARRFRWARPPPPRWLRRRWRSRNSARPTPNIRPRRRATSTAMAASISKLRMHANSSKATSARTGGANCLSRSPSPKAQYIVGPVLPAFGRKCTVLAASAAAGAVSLLPARGDAPALCRALRASRGNSFCLQSVRGVHAGRDRQQGTRGQGKACHLDPGA
jgi:hypothetical protein